MESLLRSLGSLLEHLQEKMANKSFKMTKVVFLPEKLARSVFVQRIGHCPPEIGKMVIKALKRDDDGGGLMMMMIKCSLQAPTILFPSKYDFHKIMPI